MLTEPEKLKIMSIFVLLAMGLVGGFLPIFVPKTRQLEKAVLPIANAGAGGLFVTIGIVHMLPTAVAQLQASFDKENEQYRIGYCVLVAGYILILALQRVIPLPIDGDALIEEEESAENDSLINPGEEDAPLDSHERKNKKIRAWALMIALAIHSFFAGTALGIQQDTRHVMGVFITLALHKWAAGLTLGISIVHAQKYTNFKRAVGIALVLVFSFSTPIAIGIGWGALAALPHKAFGFLFAISSGTFVYIGASEVVAEEFKATRVYALAKLVSFIVGSFIIFFATVQKFE